MPPRPDVTNSPVNRYLDRVVSSDRASWPSPRAGGLAQRRASQTHYPVAGPIVTAAFEPLSVDLPAPLTGTHWIVSYISAVGIFAVNPPLPPFGPMTGLFLVRDGTSAEGLTDGQSTQGWIPDRRGLVIPSRLDITPINPAPGNSFGFVCVALLPLPLTVTPGMVIRFLANVNPGTAQPGPGAASTVTLRAVCSVEQDQCS